MPVKSKPAMEPLLLLRAVREVSILADPEHPITVSQRRFDAARAQSQQFVSLPLARSIAKRLGRSWPEILKIAHAPPKQRGKFLGAQAAVPDQDWLTAEHVAYVLKITANRLGVNTLAPPQYDSERRRMLAENKARWLHGRRARLPTAAQIRSFTRQELYGSARRGTSLIGTWDRALELAGLELNNRSARGRVRKTTLPFDLLDRYVEEHGQQPTRRRLLRFARSNGLPYSPIRSQRVWTELIDRWKKDRAERELPGPDAPSPMSESERSLSLFRLPPKPKKTIHSQWADRDACLPFVIKYLSQIPAGEHATAHSYDAWLKQQTYRAPTSGSLRKHGGWVQMRELAHERMLRKQPTRR